MEFHRLYVGAATGAGRTAVASRSRARGGGDAHLKKNPGAFEDTGARSRLTILSLCPAHSSGAIDGAMINAGAVWPFVCTNRAQPMEGRTAVPATAPTMRHCARCEWFTVRF